MIAKDIHGNPYIKLANQKLIAYSDCLAILDQVSDTIVIERDELPKFVEAIVLLFPAELKQALSLTRLHAE